MTDREQFCTFYLGEFLFGVEVRLVQEIVRQQELTRVPLAPAPIRGLLNLRGQIVLTVDLRRCLGLPERSVPGGMNVVVQTTDGPVSLLVDRIGDILEVDESTFEKVPPTMRRPARDLIRGAHKLEHALLLELDTEKAVRMACVEQAAG